MDFHGAVALAVGQALMPDRGHSHLMPTGAQLGPEVRHQPFYPTKVGRIKVADHQDGE
jgi:hypothetical protein